MIYRILGILAITILVLSTACTFSAQESEKQLTDLNFFSDTNCLISCWKGLTVGKTDQRQIEDFLQGDSSFKNYRFVEEKDYNFYTARYLNDIGITALTRSDVLFMLELSGGFYLTLDALMSNLGEPEYLLVTSVQEPDNTYDSRATLFYPANGYVFTTETLTRERNQVCLQRETRVAVISIYASNSIEDLIIYHSFPFRIVDYQSEAYTNYIQDMLDSMKAWGNYGCITLAN